MQSRFFVVLFVLLSSILTSSHAMVIQRSFDQLVNDATHIVKGTIVDKYPHWNPQKTFIVTDYVLHVEQTLAGVHQETIYFTQAGGTIDEVSYAIPSVPQFDVGQTVVVLFDELNRRTITPITGHEQGVFQLPQSSSVLMTLNTASDRVLDVHSNVILNEQQQPLTQTEFLTTIKTLRNNPADKKHLIQKRPMFAELASTTPPWDQIRYCFGGLSNAAIKCPPKSIPLKIENHSKNWLAKVLNRQVKYWNSYATHLFHVKKADGSWAYGNGVSEFAGLISSERLNDEFGFEWSPGTLGVTLLNIVNHKIVEADIALPTQDELFGDKWTTDGLASFSDNSLHNINNTVLHELGHTWGMRHNFTNNLSVMDNRSATKFRAFNRLFQRDVTALHDYTTGIVHPILDLSVNLFYLSAGSWRESEIVRSGRHITIDKYLVENLSNKPAKAKLKWYVTPNLHDWRGAMRIGHLTTPVIPAQRTQELSVRLPIPPKLKGTYYLAIRNITPGDKVTSNNTSWISTPFEF